MNWYDIVFISISGVFSIYLLLIFMNLIFVGVFKRRLRKSNDAIKIILGSKYESIHRLILILEKYGINIDEEHKKLFLSIDLKSFGLCTSESCIKARNDLFFLRHAFEASCLSSDLICKNEEFLFLIEVIETLDKQYRYCSATYNSDILGYNYWVRFKPSRYLFLLSLVELKYPIV